MILFNSIEISIVSVKETSKLGTSNNKAKANLFFSVGKKIIFIKESKGNWMPSKAKGKENPGS